MESYEDSLYLVERLGKTCSAETDDLANLRGDRIYLSRLDGSGGKAVWKKIFVESPRPPYCYQGLCDTVVMKDKLFIIWAKQHTGDSAFKQTDARQVVKHYDFVKDVFSEESVIQPSVADAGTWNGGVTVWNDELWCAYLEVTPAENGTSPHSYSTELVVAPFRNGRCGSLFRFGKDFSPFLYAPFPTVFKGRMVIFFSDLQYYYKDGIPFEPLYYTGFDGRTFSSPVLVNDSGRNRYAKGKEYDGRLVVAYKSNSRYFEKYDYLYHDIAISSIRGTEVATTCYTRGKPCYFSAPHLTSHNGKLLLAYTRIKDGSPEGYRISYGTYIGSIDRVTPV